MDIQSQGRMSFNVSEGRWYRIAQATNTPARASSFLVNMANSYGNTPQKHLLAYIVLNGYGENLASRIAGTSEKFIRKIRIVKINSTAYKNNYVDVYIADNSKENNLAISASNMVNVKLINPIDVTEQPLPDGYTSVEFDV